MNGRDYEEGIKLYEAGRFSEAIALLEGVLEHLPPGDLNERLTRFHLGEAVTAHALQLAAAGVDEAIPQLQCALKYHPDYADLHFHLGSSYLLRGFYPDARMCFDRALAINPGYSRAMVLRGVVFFAQGDTAAGFAEIERGLTRDNRIDREPFDAARVAQGTCSHAQVLEKLLRLTGSFEDRANKLGLLARDHYRAGRLQEAVETYRKALAIAPNYADLHNHLGVSLFALDRPDLALVEFARAVEINPKYVAAHFNRAQALRRLGREPEARGSFQAVLDLDPSFEAARNALKLAA